VSEPSKQSPNPFDLLIEQIRAVVREEIRSAHNGRLAEDRLLDIDEAAKLLSVSEDWLYHNLKKLPFARKLGPKMVRFSYAGIMRWLEAKKFS
jgi:excisionase family DNA binding protein